jgi:hypothetical protein
VTLRLGILLAALAAGSVACSNGGGAIPPASQGESARDAAISRGAAVATASPTPTPLVVGPGRKYTTVASALAASQDGDTIDVVSGTYTNDFAYVYHNVTILGVGGMVKMVATEPPPNLKGFLVVEKGLTIKNFEFSGASIPASDGNNAAGIRAEGGNLIVQYCYFHDNQDGILAPEPYTPGRSNIQIDRSEFSHNGAGDGYSHNLYIGNVHRLVFTHSYSHDAVVGHELKSRAFETTIDTSVFADGSTGDASYEIDVPNAGVALVENSVIEKGPHAQNPAAIHYGGETQYRWATNSLTISSNTIIDNYGSNATAVLNQSAVNGLTVKAVLSLNKLYGFGPNDIVSGLGSVLSNNVVNPSAAAAPAIDTTAPWATAPVLPIPPGP